MCITRKSLVLLPDSQKVFTVSSKARLYFLSWLASFISICFVHFRPCDAEHHFLKFGGDKDFVTSAMTLPTSNHMQNKSADASVPRSLQLVGEIGFRSSDVADFSNQLMQVAAVPDISSVEKKAIPKKSSPPSSVSKFKRDGYNSDSEARLVPEISGNANAASLKVANASGSQASLSSRKRGGASADKEYKRMKRLLRNRVSAQQARERKKAYVCVLEMKSKALEEKNAELHERISTLERENFMLRQIVKNTTLKNAEVY